MDERCLILGRDHDADLERDEWRLEAEGSEHGRASRVARNVDTGARSRICAFRPCEATR
jgi:hypothetical protein